MTMMTDGERCEPIRNAPAGTAPVRVVVSASQKSADVVPFILIIGIGGTVASWLMLTGRLDAPFRYRSVVVQTVGLTAGIGFTVFAAALLVASRKGRSRLIEIDESNVHVRTIWRPVDIAIHDVERITTNQDRRLVVFDVRGRKHIPVLAPESADWVSVAARLTEALDKIRRSKSVQEKATSTQESVIPAAHSTDEVSQDVTAPIDPPVETSSGGLSRRLRESP